tara:strand:- start:72 stop:350 length:279 start_codon:yes stop_codon:yes gene_type:complete
MKKTTNREAIYYVKRMLDFKGSNTYGRVNSNGIYAVYSYGKHFPMYAFANGLWYGNTDKYSSTTSRHQNQLKPLNVDEWVNTKELTFVLNNY